MKITEISKIESAMEKFHPASDGAYATCRSLQGLYAQEHMQEWREDGTIGGKPASVFYIFENHEADDDMSFDASHITHIEIE